MAAQTYYCTLTAAGEAKDANAKALGIALKFTEMALGDGNGALPIPDRTRTTLVRQVRRGAINSMKTDPANPGQVIIEQVIPETEGGWWIRELGVYDADGDLVAIGNCPETYKPQLAEGSGRTQVVRMVLIMSSAATVTLKVDPSVVLATRKYVDDQDTLHVAALDPHPQYLTKTDGAAKIAAAVSALVNASPTTLDTLAELAAALGNDKDFAANVMTALALKAPMASPALSGNPTAPTPPQFDNDTSLATSEFVKKSGIQHSGPILIAATKVLSAAEAVGNLIVASGTSAGINVTLPLVSSCPAGSVLTFLNSSAFDVTVVRNGTDQINTGNTPVLAITLRPGESLMMSLIGGVSNWQCFDGSARMPFSPAFGSSKSSSGYQKLPSGLILQWGAITQNDVGGAVFWSWPLPVAFPNGGLQGFITVGSQVNGGAAYASLEGLTTNVANGYTVGPAISRIYRILVIGW
jgi:hypothetical protein